MLALAATTVVVLNDFCRVQGGASKVAIEEAAALAAAGAEVVFLGAVGPVCDQLRAPRLRVVCLDQNELLDVLTAPWAAPGVALQGLWNRAAHRAMGAILDSAPAGRTVVHLHGYTKALSTSPVRAATALGVPVVCTLHDFFAACPNGAFFDYRERAPCPRRALSPSCIAARCDKRSYAHKLFRVARSVAQHGIDRFPGGVADYIALSARSACMLRPYLPAGARLHPLQNVIDAAPGPPVDVAANRQAVFVGRLDVEKGVMLLAEAARAAGADVVFIGDGPLRPAIEAAGFPVTGWLPAAQVAARLDAARCLVFPSLWYETYGLVVGEASARGVPAIVSDITAAAERVADGRTGWHFRSGDAVDLARCLRAIDDDAAVAAAGQAAHAAFWADPPTRARHVAGLAAIYGGMLGASSAARIA